MNKENIIILPWQECLSRSFGYFLVNLKTVFSIIILGVLIAGYEAVAGTPLFCSLTQTENCTATQGAYIGVVALTTLFSVYVMVAFARFIILKDTPRPFALRFGGREIKVLGYQLLIDVIPGVIFGQIIGIMAAHINIYQDVMSKQIFLLVLVAILIAMIMLSRLSLVLSAAAVDNENMTLKKSFEVTRGNSNKIFWGNIVITLPIIVLMTVLGFVSNIAADSLVLRLIFSGIFLILIFLNVAVKMSFNAHLYQYFVYFDNKRTEDAEARALDE